MFSVRNFRHFPNPDNKAEYFMIIPNQQEHGMSQVLVQTNLALCDMIKQYESEVGNDMLLVSAIIVIVGS